MKKSLILLVVLFVGLVVAWLLLRRARPEPAKSAPSTSMTVTAPQGAPATEPSLNSPIGGAPPPSSTPPVGVRPPDAESDKRHLDKIAPLYLRPFTFYGKVIDEKGDPVVAADVRYSINNNPNPMKSGTHGELVSDANGDFAISDHGMSIFVEVSKDGYYRLLKTDSALGSHSDFQNYEKLGDTEIPIPTKGKPAIFVLRKMGEAVSLVHVKKRSIIVPKDGTPTEIDLGTGQVVAASKGQLRVEVWTQNQGMNPNKGQHYDWRCRLTMAGGGLIERKGQFDFEAPESGYAATAELAQFATAERWRDSMAKQFFVRLADNRFARINIEMIAGGDHFVVLESFLNPKSGSRNLEFDPAKEIKP